ALHGLYLCLNHLWNRFAPMLPRSASGAVGLLSLPMTFVAVVIAWVFFRADSIGAALGIIAKMMAPGDVIFADQEVFNLKVIAAYAALVWLLPNTQRLTGYDHEKRTVGESLAGWRYRPLVLYFVAALFVFGVIGIQQQSEFIYFRF